MDTTSYLGPAVVAACVAGFISLVGMIVNRSTTIKVNRDKAQFDNDLADKRFVYEKDLAERKFKFDQAQIVYKRRFELAETVLSDAYSFRDFLTYVRNGAGFSGEGETRKAIEDETDTIKRVRNTFFVPLERLNKRADFIGAMLAREHACRSHFGEPATEAFSLFNHVLGRIRVASHTLMEMAGQTDSSEEIQLRLKLKNDIWSGYGQEDELSEKIDRAVVLIESFCVPVLSEKST